MSLRWEFTRDTRFNVPYKVEIYDTEFSGSSTDLGTVGGVPVEVTMGTQHADPLEKVKGSQIIVRLWGAKGDFDDLFDRNNERFKIKLYIDGVFDAEFIPVPDTFQDYDTPGEFTVEIKAANLALLKQKQAEGVVSDGSRLAAIQDILDVYFDVPVDDGTVFYPTEANTSGSSLLQQNIQASRLEGMNCYEALEMLIPKGHQARMTKGKVIIVPVTEASFTAYNGSGGSTVYNDNFVSTKIGGRLSKTRTRLRTYDGVRRTYNPLDADNIVPSGDFDIEDFPVELDPDENEKTALPTGWSAVRNSGFTTSVVRAGTGYAWKVPESFGTLQAQQQSGGTGLFGNYESWKVTSKQVLAGERLKIAIRYNYESRNSFALMPIKIKIGNQILFRGRNASGSVVDSDPVWRTETGASERHLNHLLLGCRADLGFQEVEILTPQVPATGVLSIEVETPTVDRAWERGNNFVEIESFEMDPANEEGEILTERDTLAGEEGDVYEYTEGFGDGFSSYNPGALFNKDSEISFTPKAENLTDLWVYNGNDNNVPSTQLSLSELETKYLASILTTDRDRLNGTVDVYDFIALIDGYRVNYIQTDFRFGRSTIELIEIRDHDLEAVIEDRKKKKDTGPIRTEFPFPPIPINQLQAIGETTEGYIEESVTEIGVEISQPLRVGLEYWIINENELSREDRESGIYPFIPEATNAAGDRVAEDTEGAILEYGPGRLDGDTSDKLPIQEQVINAPSGSFIYKSPNQQEVEDNVFQNRIDEANANLDNLNNVELPALQDALDQLNNVDLPALNDDLDQLQIDLTAAQNQLDDVLPITETKISDDAISTPKIQTNAITSGKIVTGAITAIKIAAGAIIAEKIGANAVTANKIAADAVTTNKILAGAITTEKIGANQVTANKIDVADLYATNAIIEAILTFESGGGEIHWKSSGGTTNATLSHGVMAFDGFTGTSGAKISGALICAGLHVTNSFVMPETSGDLSNDANVILRTSGGNNMQLISDGDLVTGFNGNGLQYNDAEDSGTIGTSQDGYITVTVNGSTRYIRLYS